MTSEWKEYELEQIIDMLSKKVSVHHININNYISTENMIAEKGGITLSSGLPAQNNYLEFKKGDVLFSNIRTYFKKIWQATFSGGASNDIIVFRTKDKQVLDQSFLFYLISNDNFIDFTITTAKGTKMPRGDRDAMKKFKFRIPVDVEEQKNIAIILNSLEQKINCNKNINQTLESISQTLFKSWFVDFDLVNAKIEAKEQGKDPQLAGMMAISGKSEDEINQMPADKRKQLAETADLFPEKMVESELGEIPKGWKIKPIDEIANFLNGLALQKYPASNNETFLPVVKIVQLKKGEVKGAEKASIDIPKEYIIDNGDVVFSWSGSLFADVWCGGKGALNQHLFKVTSTNYPKWFYYQWIIFHLPEFIRIAADKAVTMGHIKREHLSQAMCIVPDEMLIKKADFIFSNLLEMYIFRKVESLKLAETRDNLLPKLLSGELNI